MKTRRLYRVISTYDFGVNVYHFQTKRAAERNAEKRRNGYSTWISGWEGPTSIQPANSVVIEESDPITWPGDS